MSDVEKHFLLLCGDLNLHLTSLDSRKLRFSITTPAQMLTDVMKEHDLIDLWRHKNPTTRRYTWRRLTPQLKQSRLDYIIVSEQMILNNVVNRVEINPSVLTDHSVVSAEFTIFTSDKGPGLFRFKNELLEDRNFVESARSEIERAKLGRKQLLKEFQ